MKIFGLAGTNGSGKDTLAQLLEREYGFLNVSATKLLEAELTKRGQSFERINKAALSAEWRRELGMAAIVDKAVELFQETPEQYKGLIVGSLRHPGETDRVHELGGTQFWIDADPKIRYDRITKNDRGRIEDQKTFDEFMADEKREMSPVGDAATLNMGAVKDKSDVFIENNEPDIESFETQTRRLLDELLAAS